MKISVSIAAYASKGAEVEIPDDAEDVVQAAMDAIDEDDWCFDVYHNNNFDLGDPFVCVLYDEDGKELFDHDRIQREGATAKERRRCLAWVQQFREEGETDMRALRSAIESGESPEDPTQ